MLVTYQDLAKFLIILMIPEPHNTHKYLYARWSTFSDQLHTVSLTMQPHDQNSTLSLRFNYSCDLYYCVLDELDSEISWIPLFLSPDFMVSSLGPYDDNTKKT